ncbi:MAG: phosphopantetheine-binding protein [Eubacteriales bacterium]
MFDEVKAMLVNEMSIDAADVTEDAEFVKDLGFNSLEIADLVVMCEEKYGIDIDEDRAHSIITVGDFADYLAEATAQK